MGSERVDKRTPNELRIENKQLLAANVLLQGEAKKWKELYTVEVNKGINLDEMTENFKRTKKQLVMLEQYATKLEAKLK